MEENKNQTPEGQQAEEQSVAETKGAAVGDESKNENVDTAPNTDTLMAEIARMKVSEQKNEKGIGQGS